MSRLFPNGSTGALRIPVYAGAPNGGDPFSLYLRLFLPAAWNWTGSNFTRLVTRREGAGAGSWVLQGIGSPPTTTPSFQAQFSGTGNIGAWNFPALATGKWIDLLLSYDYSTWTSVPSMWVNGAPAAPSATNTPVSGTPNVHLNDIQIGNRLNGLCPAQSAIAELAWWKGRLLNQREANLISTYGPDAVSRSRTGWWNLDTSGKDYIASHDGPNPIVPSSGSGITGFPIAPPRRKRRWWNIPLAYVPPPTVGGSAGEGESASGTATETIAGSGSAGEGEGASGTGSGATVTATGSAAEGESASGSAGVSGAPITGTGTAGEGESVTPGVDGEGNAIAANWQPAQYFHDATSGKDYISRVWKPAGYTPGTPLPVMVYLHGNVENGFDGVQHLKWINTPLVQQGASFNQFCLAVQKNTNTSDASAGYMRQIMAALAQLQLDYNIDATRVTLMGFSAGAEIAFRLLYDNPNVFAAFTSHSGEVIWNFWSPPATDLTSALAIVAAADAYQRTPIYQWNGTADTTIPIAEARQTHTALAAVNPNYLYTETAGDHVGTMQTATAAASALWPWLYDQQLLVASGAAAQGEGASGSGTVSGSGVTGAAGEGESASGTATETIVGTGAASEGESGSGSGAVGGSGVTGSAGEGESASGTASETIVGSGSAGEGQSASGVSGGAAISGSGTAGDGEGASGSGAVTDPATGAANDGGGASGTGSVRVDGTGAAGEGEGAHGSGLVELPGAPHPVTCRRVYAGPAVRVRRVYAGPLVRVTRVRALPLSTVS